MKTLHPGRLNIGPRLILGGTIIILSMLAADVVVLWQFRELRSQAQRLNDIDQKLVAVLRVHSSLLAFHDRLDALADTESVDQLVREAAPFARRSCGTSSERRPSSASSRPTSSAIRRSCPRFG